MHTLKQSHCLWNFLKHSRNTIPPIVSYWKQTFFIQLLTINVAQTWFKREDEGETWKAAIIPEQSRQDDFSEENRSFFKRNAFTQLKQWLELNLVTSHAALLLLEMEKINSTFLFSLIKTLHSLPPYSRQSI